MRKGIFTEPSLFRLLTDAGGSKAKRSPFLLTREQGKVAAEALERRMQQPSTPLVLDFSGIDVATPSFLDELCHQIDRDLRKHGDEGMIVVAVYMKPDVTDSFMYVLQRHKHALAYGRGDEIDLLNASPILKATLRAAIELAVGLGGEFTVPQLAEALELPENTVNQRLTQLRESGAVARERDASAERGIRYRYRAPSRDLLSV